jgi:hypothetical protein
VDIFHETCLPKNYICIPCITVKRLGQFVGSCDSCFITHRQLLD